jgi:hypothetical protein
MLLRARSDALFHLGMKIDRHCQVLVQKFD